MKSRGTSWNRMAWALGLCLGVRVAAGAEGTLPPAATGPVDFGRDIRPILEASCTKCHGKGKAKGGFSLETREKLLQGGDNGPAVVVNRSGESYLIELVAGLDPDNVMPQKGSKLSPEQVGLLRAWIDQGMAWSEGVTFARPPALNLEARAPALPEGDAAANPIDRFLAPYFEARGVPPGEPVEDRIFARRVYLDVIGLLPSPEAMEAFVRDGSADKRGRLVDRLLADRPAYAQHWLTFWNDLLRNDYRGTGYIDDGRKPISGWLYASLAENKPFDRFVEELIDPGAESEGFVKGIVWRGVVNASQTPQMQAAQNIAQVFMGVNLKCASCHDSFISDWALADAYALASVFADEPLEMFECDRPTGRKAGVAFLYPQLGEIPAGLNKAERQSRLAEIMTRRENGRLTRTVVNRLWQRFMGRGLVEPVDDMEQTAWHQDLLDWLAEDLAGHGYDLQHTMRRILTSRAYQLPAVSLPEEATSDYVFRGPGVRRMTAEQFRDALGTLTGVWFEKPEGAINHAAGRNPGVDPVLMAAVPQWIWTDREAVSKAMPETVYFRKTFHLDAVPEVAAVVATCDNRFNLFLNGHQVLSGGDYKKPGLAFLRDHVRAGVNVVAVEATNDKQKSDDPNDPGANPAGLLVYLHLRSGAQVWDVGSDGSWVWTREKVEGWETGEARVEGWAAAHALGEPGMEPWKLEGAMGTALSVILVHGEVRSSLVAADPLMTALGRPPREQLLTTRTPTATTLQALELTNGQTLADVLGRGANRLLEEAGGREVVRDVFARALGRAPSEEEARLAQDLVGDPLRREGVEDLLWAVTMLPEFQLIY